MARKEKIDWMARMDRRAMAWLWRLERPRRGPTGWGMFVLQSVYLAGRSSFLHRLPFQAHALTFITLLALVPALAISFALAKGLGFSDALQQLLINNEFLSGQQEVFQQIIGYVQRTNVGALGALGLVFLMLTLIMTISSVEETFNRIWQVSAQRSWYRKFTDYFSVMVICPLLIFAATGVWATFSSHYLVRWLLDVNVVGGLALHAPSLGPLVMLTAAFVFVYLFLPNTRVPFISALTAGVTAAGLWWLVQTLYILFQVGVARYNAIYGGFASLPLFMIWLQVSWTVVLFGAELAHAHHVCRLGTPPVASALRITPAQREVLALGAMLRVCRRFRRGEDPYTLQELARELEAPLREMHSTAGDLAAAGLLIPVADQEEGYAPGRALDVITPAHVLDAVRGEGANGGAIPAAPGDAEIRRLLDQARRLGRQVLERVTFQELAKDD